MRQQILAATAALALAAGLTTSAMAFDHAAVGHSRHIGHRASASAGTHSFRGAHVRRFAGVRGFESRRNTGWNGGDAADRGGFVSLGPLGMTTACGDYRHRPSYCGPGYSVSAWSW